MELTKETFDRAIAALRRAGQQNRPKVEQVAAYKGAVCTCYVIAEEFGLIPVPPEIPRVWPDDVGDDIEQVRSYDLWQEFDGDVYEAVKSLGFNPATVYGANDTGVREGRIDVRFRSANWDEVADRLVEYYGPKVVQAAERIAKDAVPVPA